MRSTTKQTLRFYWKHLKAYKWLFFGMIVTAVIAVGFNLTVPYFLKLFVDHLSMGVQTEGVAESLMGFIGMILLMEAGQWVFWRLNNFMADYTQPRMAANIVNESFEYLQKHSYNFFNNEFVGSLVKKVNRLSHSFLGLTSKLYWDVTPLFTRMIVIFVILMWLHPLIGVAMLVWTALYITLSYLFSVYKLKFDLKRAEQDSKMSGALADSITNNINVKLFSALPFEMRRLKKVTDEWRRRAQKSWMLGTIVESIQGVLMIGFDIAILYFSVRLWQEEVLTVGDIVWIQAYLLDLFRKLWDFGKMVRVAYEELANAEEMIVILNRGHEVKDLKKAPSISVARGKVEFKKVQFSYSQDRPIIQSLDLTIKPSEKVALIGPSGGGKSTITKLLMRFYDIQKGQILVDDQDISSVTQASLRGSIGFVPQDPILFHRSLMDNIRYGRREATNQEVIAAAKLANCHEFIMNFEGNYDTFVGERGVKLSGGEKQRVAIARAILANAPILVLDEATSALDSETELLIQEALENLMKQKTTIVIAHRLSTIMKMDRILVVQDGQLVEQGTHAELLNKEIGLYKKLWNLQVGGYVGS